MFDCLRYTSHTMLARRYQQVHVDTKSATAMFNCLRYTLHWRTATTRSTWTPRAPTPCSTVSGIPLAPCWRAATNRSTWTPRAPTPCSTVSGIPLTPCWRAATTRSTWTPRAPPPCSTVSGIPLTPSWRSATTRSTWPQVYLTLARCYDQVHVDTKSATAMFDYLRYLLHHVGAPLPTGPRGLRYTLHWRTATTRSTWTPRAPPPCLTVSGIPYIGATLRPGPRGHQERHRHVRFSQVYCVPYSMLARRYQVHVDTKSATAMFDCLRYTLHWRTATNRST